MTTLNVPGQRTLIPLPHAVDGTVEQPLLVQPLPQIPARPLLQGYLAPPTPEPPSYRSKSRASWLHSESTVPAQCLTCGHQSHHSLLPKQIAKYLQHVDHQPHIPIITYDTHAEFVYKMKHTFRSSTFMVLRFLQFLCSLVVLEVTVIMMAVAAKTGKVNYALDQNSATLTIAVISSLVSNVFLWNQNYGMWLVEYILWIMWIAPMAIMVQLEEGKCGDTFDFSQIVSDHVVCQQRKTVVLFSFLSILAWFISGTYVLIETVRSYLIEKASLSVFLLLPLKMQTLERPGQPATPLRQDTFRQPMQSAPSIR